MLQWLFPHWFSGLLGSQILANGSQFSQKKNKLSSGSLPPPYPSHPKSRLSLKKSNDICMIVCSTLPTYWKLVPLNLGVKNSLIKVLSFKLRYG